MSSGQKVLKVIAIGLAIWIVVMIFAVAMLALTIFAEVAYEIEDDKDSYYEYYDDDYDDYYLRDDKPKKIRNI